MPRSGRKIESRVEAKELTATGLRRQVLAQVWKIATETDAGGKFVHSNAERYRSLKTAAHLAKSMPEVPGLNQAVLKLVWREANDPSQSGGRREQCRKLMVGLSKTLPDSPGVTLEGESEGQRLLNILLTGTSQQRVALRAGVTQPAVRGWQAGASPGADVRARLWKAYEIPIASWDEPARPPPPKAPADVLAELQLDKGFAHFAVHAGEGYPFTVAQSAMVKVAFDGLEPKDLTGDERKAAYEIFGPVETVPERARRTVAIEAGRHSGKTSITARFVAYRCLTADVSGMFRSTVPAFAVLAPRLKVTAQLFNQVVTFLNELPAVKERVKVANNEEIVFARPTDGRDIAVRVYPRSPAGRALRGQDFVGLAVDEAQFGEVGHGDAIVTDADQIEAARPRLRGLEILLSSLWAAPSYMRDVIETNWRKPTTALVVRGKTLTMRRGGAGYDEVALERSLELADPMKESAARREFDLEADDGETLFYEASLVDAAIELDIGEPTRQNVSAGMDLGFRNDFSALVITERQGGKLVVVGVYVRKPSQGRQLDPEVVTREFAELAKSHGATYVCADSHCAEQTERACRTAGLLAIILDRSRLTPAADQTRTLLVQRRLAIPHPSEARPQLVGAATLARELKSIRSKPGPGGTTEFLRPRVQGAGHCDVASALEMAVYDDARRFGPFAEARRDIGGVPFGAIQTRFSRQEHIGSHRTGWMPR